MTASELSPRSAFQIFFKCSSFRFRFEREYGFNPPWSMWRTVRAFPSIVFKQALSKISRDPSVVNLFVLFANENVYVKKFIHRLACQAVAFGAPTEKLKHSPPSLRYGVAAFALSRCSKAKAGPAWIRTRDQGIMSPLLYR